MDLFGPDLVAALGTIEGEDPLLQALEADVGLGWAVATLAGQAHVGEDDDLVLGAGWAGQEIGGAGGDEGQRLLGAVENAGGTLAQQVGEGGHVAQHVFGGEGAVVQAQLELQNAEHGFVHALAEGGVGIVFFAEPVDGVLDVGELSLKVVLVPGEVGDVKEVVAGQERVFGYLAVGEFLAGVVVEALNGAHAQGVRNDEPAVATPGVEFWLGEEGAEGLGIEADGGGGGANVALKPLIAYVGGEQAVGGASGLLLGRVEVGDGNKGRELYLF